MLCAGIWGAFWALSGCGPKTTSNPGDGGGGSGVVENPTNASDFFAAEGRSYCARVFRCQEGNDDFTSARLVLQTQARCEDLVARLNDTQRSQRDLNAQLSSGAIHYVAAQGAKCLADLGTCNGANSFEDGACREVFDGNAKTGEACQRDEDCSGDAYCHVVDACPGMCAPRKLQGESCSQASECAEASGVARCNYDGTGNGTCHTLARSAAVGQGEPCTRRLGTQDSLVFCQDGLWCRTAAGGDPSEDAMGVCAPPIVGSEACEDQDDVCKSGLCDTDTGVCRPVTLQKSVGAACDKEQYIVCDPLVGLQCGLDGTCLGSGNGTQGSTCFTSDFQRGCDAGLYCQKPDTASSSSDPGTCTPQLAANSACNNDNDCADGGCVAGVCQGRYCFY